MSRRGYGYDDGKGGGWGPRQVVTLPAHVPVRSILRSDQHEPFLDLLNWIFEPHIGGIPSMTGEQRVAWMQRHMPRTYSALTVSQRWAELTDL